MTALPMLIAEETRLRLEQGQCRTRPAAQVYAHPTFGIQMTGARRRLRPLAAVPHHRRNGARHADNAATQKWKADKASWTPVTVCDRDRRSKAARQLGSSPSGNAIAGVGTHGGESQCR